MKTFVEQCRQEWRRLRVPDAIANEMAADLQADLDEAEAEGASAESVLGNGAFDPRSFAASWAAERGVIGPQPPATVDRFRPRFGLLSGLAAAGLLAILGLALLSGRSSVAVAARRHWPAPWSPGPGGVVFMGHGPGIIVPVIGLVLLATAIMGLVLLFLRHSPWSARASSSRRVHGDDDPGGFRLY